MNTNALIHIENFAKLAHSGQLRKYTKDDYIIHPMAVAKLVKAIGGNFEMVAAALLHDVIEDTPVTSNELLIFLHSDKVGITPAQAISIHKLVVDLTDIYTKENFPHLNRKARKQLEAERLGNVSGLAQTIKYCDLYDNTKSITEHDPGFAKTYMAEKAILIQHMQGGNSGMRKKSLDNLIDYNSLKA